MVQTFLALKTSQHLHHLLPFSAELQPVPLLNWRLQLSQAPLKVAITAAFIADKERLGVINNLSSDDKLPFTLFFCLDLKQSACAEGSVLMRTM